MTSATSLAAVGDLAAWARSTPMVMAIIGLAAVVGILVIIRRLTADPLKIERDR